MRGDTHSGTLETNGQGSREESFLAAMEGTDQPKKVVSPADLRLVNRKIPIRFCEYRISNTPHKMLQTDTVSVSNVGLMFHSPVSHGEGSLMRVWMEMPDYWARKSRHVSYRHTSAPSFFQILSRVLSCEDVGKRIPKFQVICEIVNLDAVDEIVLCEYLGVDIPDGRE